jgi:hypothetical protein
LTGNIARDKGGGAYDCTLVDCLIAGNAAGNSSGGAFYSKLTNCTVVANSANAYAGGVDSGTLKNCIVYCNRAPIQSNWVMGLLSYCCTQPLPRGAGNITNAPLFVDLAAGNLRLQSNSPCINSGLGTNRLTETDLDGNPRMAGEAVDMGAYELQSPGSSISYAWLQQYGLSTDGLADSADPDGDGWNNLQEWRAGTNPTNALSAPHPFKTGPDTAKSSE